MRQEREDHVFRQSSDKERYAQQRHDGGTYLERNREGGKALREEPDNGVADPGEDDNPGDLAVEGRHVTSLDVSSSLEGLCEVDNGSDEAGNSDEEPEPLDGGDDRHRSHVHGEDHDD